MTPNLMAVVVQMLTSGVGRPMVPNGTPSMPGGSHVQASAMMNQVATQQHHQAAGRPAVPIEQVTAPPSGSVSPRQSIASVVAATANTNPYAQTVAH
ncbi:hypothetical protein D915_001378 [Fasciola hepatica]|uniref:Uncharacterized protein n=1 Tax=Fasciola hepatica TaxID=6192 RepID=A0A4E0RLS0_FASHE|nr:hypothetical protein D915_001378 [Fasciola hepatica]